jgi:selenocysteine lyase/cysteine desulfurase
MGGGQVKTPGRREPQPGQDGRFATAAGTCNLIQNHNLRQALRLRMAFGLTEAQANALASLIWGAA